MALEGGFGGTLASLWEHLRKIGVALGPLWRHFGVSLVSVWVSVADLASLDGHFALIVESPWAYKGPSSKNNRFPNRFQ